jgi:hypothetical protein
MKKVLFVLKRKEDYRDVQDSPKGLSSGLYNSASYVVNVLREQGVEANIEVVIDNSFIDREVTKHRPDIVICEALWIVPSKFRDLIPLHPNVEWVVRIHSEMPFMAGEGIAMDWISDYVTWENVNIGVNAPRMLSEIREYLKTVHGWDNETTNRRVIYMPNAYPTNFRKKKGIDEDSDTIDIGCFGAVRPMKNHLLQAHGALKFANAYDKKLRFHINANRVEMNGGAALRNIRDMFAHLGSAGHQLIEHDWADRDDFLHMIRNEIDIGLQVSFSETFNIVGCDVISQGVPLVSSNEIPWSSSWFDANPTNSDHIAAKLESAYCLPGINVFLNQRGITKYVDKTTKVWLDYLKEKK